MPNISEEEFREQLERTYRGSDRERKKFKMAHYLIQLEDVELLESHIDSGPRTWSGNDEVWQDILREQDLLEPVSEIVA